MSTHVQFIDRDEAVAQMRAEREEHENETVIRQLLVQLGAAQEALRISEQQLKVIEESLGGTPRT